MNNVYHSHDSSPTTRLNLKKLLLSRHISYPVHNLRPSFHCYALEDCYHSESDVVKCGNAIVGTFPVMFTACVSTLALSPVEKFTNSWPGLLITRTRIWFKFIWKGNKMTCNWVSDGIWSPNWEVRQLGSQAGVVNINHAFHLYCKCCMWIEFQSISTWLRGFSPGTPVSSLLKLTPSLIHLAVVLCSKVTHGPYSGCQGRLSMLSVRPCLSCVVAVLCDGD